MVRRAKLIWKQSQNPTDYVSGVLEIERWQPRNAIHRIKDADGMGGTDLVRIYDDGSVEDEGGRYVGNIFDEI